MSQTQMSLCFASNVGANIRHNINKVKEKCTKIMAGQMKMPIVYIRQP